MPRGGTKSRAKTKKGRPAPPPTDLPDVLTAAEAAEYLRVSEEDLLRSAVEQGLPGRIVGAQWRFLKSARDDWLRTAPKPSSRAALLATVGAWKDDPYLDECSKRFTGNAADRCLRKRDDPARHLVDCMMSEEDRTEEFVSQLRGLGEKFRELSGVSEEFEARAS